MTTSTDPGGPDLWQLLRTAAENAPSPRRDVALLFAAPALVMTVVFVTMSPSSFEYEAAHPTLWGIYTSNIAHRSWQHLLGNLVGLLLIGGTEYVLLTAAGYRTYYIGLFLGTLLVFPLVGNLFFQYVVSQQPAFRAYEAVGFSEPVAAMAGSLPLVLVIYQDHVIGLRWPLVWAFSLALAGIVWAFGQVSGILPLLFAAGLLGGVGLAGVGYHGWRSEHSGSIEARIHHGLLFSLVLALYVISVVGLFPERQPARIVGHLAGFLPGAFLPLFLLWGFSLSYPAHDLAIDLD